MHKDQRRRLEQAGWTVGDAATFLGLDELEARWIETKLALASGLRERRRKLRWTQAELARRLGSSQSRIAKMEAADRSVSTDLLLRSLFVLGASRREVGRLLARGGKRRQAA
jgi:hypothetical protein